MDPSRGLQDLEKVQESPGDLHPMGLVMEKEENPSRREALPVRDQGKLSFTRTAKAAGRQDIL